MAVVLEVTIPDEGFALGRATQTETDVTLELERVVPTGDGVMPFVWAEGAEFDSFEAAVDAEQHVESITPIVKLSERALYHIRWRGSGSNLTSTLTETDATVLEGHGNDPWRFRFRFRDHTDVQQFHERCQGHDIPFHVERLYRLEDVADATDDFDLTEEQEVALAAAVEQGYFTVPRQATLSDIAGELDITPQAASERIRRGTDAVLRAVLADSNSADEGGAGLF